MRTHRGFDIQDLNKNGQTILKYILLALPKETTSNIHLSAIHNIVSYYKIDMIRHWGLTKYGFNL